MKDCQMFIGGERCDASDGKKADVINPSKGEAFARLPLGTEEDTEREVRAARESFDSRVWRNMAQAERSRIMLDIPKTFKEMGMDLSMAKEVAHRATLGQYYLIAPKKPLEKEFVQWLEEAHEGS